MFSFGFADFREIVLATGRNIGRFSAPFERK
jgi:hypothetical protein